MSFLPHRPLAQTVQADRINLHNPQAAAVWEQKLHADREQLRRAIAAVGDKASKVEKYLQDGTARDGDKPH